MRLRIAIVHYHLRPGGVTRVVEHAVAALAPLGHDVVILCGETPAGSPPFDARIEVVPDLAYAAPGARPPQTGFTDRLREAAAKALGASPDVWHVHNHSLGKNATLPTAVAELAASGEALLLQLHDFAEDSRPANWALLRSALEGADVALYPQSPRVRYAVLNGRDERALRAAGVPIDALGVLANPITGTNASAPPPATGRPLVLYPTRAIRRKNLGEFLLWSVLLRDEARCATTLSPQNPQEQPAYENWRRVASDLALPVDFAVGERRGASFESLVHSATALITTSVTEGFGMCFLEPWLFGRSVIGRDLPEITADFKEAGIDLSSLYERLDVPLDWVGKDALRERLQRALDSSYRLFGRSVPSDALERAYRAAVTESEEGVDFGRLDESLQEAVLRRVAEAPEELRPAGAQLTLTATETNVMTRNAVRIAEDYSLPAYGNRLEALYRDLAEAPAESVSSLPKEAVLDAFLRPERLLLLRN